MNLLQQHLNAPDIRHASFTKLAADTTAAKYQRRSSASLPHSDHKQLQSRSVVQMSYFNWSAPIHRDYPRLHALKLSYRGVGKCWNRPASRDCIVFSSGKKKEVDRCVGVLRAVARPDFQPGDGGRQ